MEISFTKFGELMACEATFQATAINCRKYGLLLLREEFLGGTFTIIVTCDGLIAVAQAGCTVNLILQKVARPNGLPHRGFVQ